MSLRKEGLTQTLNVDHEQPGSNDRKHVFLRIYRTSDGHDETVEGCVKPVANHYKNDQEEEYNNGQSRIKLPASSQHILLQPPRHFIGVS